MNNSLAEISQKQEPFLARSAEWEWHDNERIDILDHRNQLIHHLDEWQTLVFQEADGNTTMSEIVEHFPSYYSNKNMVPVDYERYIVNATRTLVEELKVIDLWTNKDNLPHKYVWPIQRANRS